MRALAALTSIVSAGVLLAGCGGGSTSTITVVQTATVVRTTTVHVVTGTDTVGATEACTGDAMTGSFAVVSGSAGAGQIVYKLRLKNDSPVACFVSGFPQVQLLGQGGTDLPTKEIPEQPGTAAAARIMLQPGSSAAADVRFSPDVPGTGDQTGGDCEPKATMLRVALAGAPLDLAVSPPTPVCERGTLQYRLLTAAS